MTIWIFLMAKENIGECIFPAAPDICFEISNKISTREAFSVVEATKQNVLEAFLLPSNRDKLPLIAIKAISSSLAGFSPVKVLSKRHTWVSPNVASTPTKSPKVFNNRSVNKLVFFSIASTSGAAKQSLVFAIVTLNPFVVPNEILDEISIASSSTSFKMGQDQLLVVLPNVVSSGRSSPVLEAKQSPSVGSPVLENWADQIETDLSPPLVSGATSGGAWETITSLASTLVSGTIFKIKLAHIKTVFQSVHGFLGAKSVSKDNVKLFCMEFASQQSLKAAFLVKLTSSVCLATFKIAKFLVVSKSGSFPAAVVLHDVSLGVFTTDVKLAFNSAVSALKHWSVLMDKDSVRILSLVNQNETILFRDKFKTKLVNLPLGCTAFEISNMISQIGGRTCFIPCFPNSGDLDSAVVKTSTLRKCCIWCQEMGYLAMDCKISPPPTPKVSKIFKSCFVGFALYTKTAALFGLSEFPPLVASSAVSAANSAVSFKLNSLEKQISDLAALVRSIAEPVSSLVVLVSRLFDNNTVKTSAANNFFNLMVGVFKDIACLRSEVDFNNMDYNSMLAAKPSFLSKDTIECVITLWRMSGAETRSNIKST
ncbi:hypothetical protein G9A89_010911 [Geosiphon pyriformis]|nr:hypothetical protein G9A89_010911 [Geosiphon pyriformis]